MMKHDPIMALELILTHYQMKLKDNLSETETHKYEAIYLTEYHELHMIDKDKAKPYMDWWVRYAKW